MASAAEYFSDHYQSARARFLEVARAEGAEIKSWPHPLTDAEGRPLVVDVALLGPADAQQALLAISGTHGAEGFCGSGAQVGWLESGLWREAPAQVRQVLVHGINPHGFANLSRVTQENVDLNRNFIDFSQGAPRNEGYDELASALAPSLWDEETRKTTAQEILAYGAEHGTMAMQAAVAGGQYHHPDGLFFGGEGPSWSHRTLVDILQSCLGDVRALAIIDYHTGLGPYGYGERICTHHGSKAGARRASDWYGGDVTVPSLGTSSSPELHGLLIEGIEAALPETEATMIALEYGTQPLPEVLEALRADNWLLHHGDPASEQGRAIKAEMRRCFYGDADDWKDMIWERAVDTQRLALAGLTES